MAINSRKISGLSSLQALTGDEYLMVAYNNRSYKVPVSAFTSDIITSIEQTINQGDEKNNPIRITTSDGTVYTFSVRNGAKGSTGDQGPKGATGDKGDTGVALYGADVADLILNTLNGKSEDGTITYTPEELTELILSAAQGHVLNEKLVALEEVYCTQDRYDEMLEAGEIDANVKYFIIEEEESGE